MNPILQTLSQELIKLDSKYSKNLENYNFKYTVNTPEINQKVLYILADYSVRVFAVKALESKGLKDEANILKSLDKIVDKDSCKKAYNAADADASASSAAYAAYYAAYAAAYAAYWTARCINYSGGWDTNVDKMFEELLYLTSEKDWFSLWE